MKTIGIIVVALIAICIFFSGPSAAEAPAKPMILDTELETNMFTSNKINVRIRNDGLEGWVVISYSTTQTSTDYSVRRRGKIERTVRDAINGDDDKYVLESDQHTKIKGAWQCCTLLKAGEIKLIQLELPGHSGLDDQRGTSVSAVLSKPTSTTVK